MNVSTLIVAIATKNQNHCPYLEERLQNDRTA